MSKSGVDEVINKHFSKVFAQNDVPKIKVWEDYWETVDEVFDLINEITINSYSAEDEPTFDEIDEIIKAMKVSKASYGSLSIDLTKLGGEKISRLIYRCILQCFKQNILPSALRVEKMTLLLKSKGVIDEINDYRGIFLRNVIVSVYQKWLYTKCSVPVDEAGSEFACGGRKGRAVTDPLLVVKLVQDYAKWTKKEVVLKFLDVEKFFDSMNYKLALIEGYKNGVEGRYWQCYKTINSKKTCVPHIPSGTCTPIEIENVFLQGSCDAVLFAWPLMDADSKREGDCFSSEFFIEGIPLSRITFVDDLFGLEGSIAISNESSISHEVFEKKTRMKFKLKKCKVILMNCKGNMEVVMNGEILEAVKDHVYLGTIISSNGERFTEMNSRITKSNSVANEIVQICKIPELSSICLRYVKVLIISCLDSKVKFGCSLWNVTKFKSSGNKLNRIKPSLLKQVLQVPKSTPSDAILYEFGINDLVLDVLMEKVILAVETLSCNENRISKRILEAMMIKNVPGFCTELVEACQILDVSVEKLINEKDVRSMLKKKVVELQAAELMRRMIASSKMDKVILNGFCFDGRMMKYLNELDLNEARAIFMSRYRMWPTKTNYPGRWKDCECNVCGLRDTDDHIFSCPGYTDIIGGKFRFDAFWDSKILEDMTKLKEIAAVVLEILSRLEVVQNL